ncbi:hypothetical protein VPHD51_0207 [Vibrio phage D51]
MNTVTNFRAMLAKLDNLVDEYGHYKTANMITDAYELDMINEAQGRTLRFQLARQFASFLYHDEDAADKLIGLDRIDLASVPVVETARDAMFNRLRTDCVFSNTINAMSYGI